MPLPISDVGDPATEEPPQVDRIVGPLFTYV